MWYWTVIDLIGAFTIGACIALIIAGTWMVVDNYEGIKKAVREALSDGRHL